MSSQDLVKIQILILTSSQVPLVPLTHSFQNRGPLISLNTTDLNAHEGKNGS